MFEIEIDGFSGPLDLLCHLIEQSEIEAAHISVSEVISIYTSYLAKNASKIASEIGGAINTSMGDMLQSDVKKIWGKTKSGAKNLWKIIKENS